MNFKMRFFTVQDDYKTCNFDNATLFKPVTEDLKTREKHVVVQLNTPGMQYFAAVQYCNDTPPLKIAVSVTVPSKSACPCFHLYFHVVGARQ